MTQQFAPIKTHIHVAGSKAISNCQKLLDDFLDYMISLFFSLARAGGKLGATARCRVCSGRGVKVTLRQLGPGMVQQMQSICPECHGEGMLRCRSDCVEYIYSFEFQCEALKHIFLFTKCCS